MRKLFLEMLALLSRGEDLVLVTVIAGSGSTPRGAGARMIVRMDGSSMGTIGGGAVEYHAGILAAEGLKEKKSYAKSFQLAKNQIADLGMICGGDVSVYFQYINSADQSFQDICRKGLEFCEKDEDSWLITDITDETAWAMGIYSKSQGLVGLTLPETESLKVKKPSQVVIENRVYYSEPLVSAGKVFIFGGGHVAQELVPVISHLGFRCVVFDDREEFANRELFPQAEDTLVGDFEQIHNYIEVTDCDYLVIMTRGHQFDYLIQRQALKTDACYIGVIGSRNKLKTLSGKLMEEGFTQKDIQRFYGPIGTPILAETPAEIAISIAGELIKIRAEREGRSKH